MDPYAIIIAHMALMLVSVQYIHSAYGPCGASFHVAILIH